MTITSCPRLIFVLAFAAACGVSNDGFAQTDSDLTSGQIRDAADRVMKQHDYRSVRRRMLENIEPDRERGGFLQDSLSRMAGGIGDFFEWIFSGLFTSRNRNTGGGTAPSSPVPAPSSGGGLDLSFGTVLLYLALAILVVITVWLIAAVVRKSDGRRSLDRRGLFGEDEDLADLSIPPGELAASTYESRANQMARQGNYRGAIRELLIGSMSWIERAGLIRYRKGLTNRDYVRAVWRQEDRRHAYASTAIEFERVYFGRRQATEQMFKNCLSSFQGSFREEETPAAV